MFLLLWLAASVEGVCRNGQILSSGLTCSQKKEILDVHNELRNLVASGKGINLPPAQDMHEMRWSDLIANTAQTLADRCTFAHDTGIGGVQVGQNIAIMWSRGKVETKNDLKSLMDGWINEGKDYVAGVFDSATGHYSQMIWGRSAYVGCGYTVYKQNGFENKLLVCNYLPPGNYIGQPPYTYGDVNCRKHGKLRSSKYKHLCAVDRNKTEIC